MLINLGSLYTSLTKSFKNPYLSQKAGTSQFTITEAPDPRNVRCSGINVSSDLNPEKYQFYTQFTSYTTSMFRILRLHIRVSPSYQYRERSLILFSFYNPNFLWNSGPLR